MSISLSTPNLEPNMSHGNVGLKVAQMSKEQQKIEGDIALKLIESALPEAAPAPVGNAGHIISTKA
ncbi:cytoplasmic protein [Shewanella sp. KX20019]|uniref:cytoplasmic protein n=1 Tax=Shewanella sp. KX20019 TaxID=2803864 RepID=UPI0019280F98|nr:cytoplasmic protein [Shewanella sp. KX20019]QQX81026.1 cytoplasmic protein [Shewanella sp. KX20019]